MSGGIATDRSKDQSSKTMIGTAAKRLETESLRHVGHDFHGSVSVTITFWDGGVTNYIVDQKETRKTE